MTTKIKSLEGTLIDFSPSKGGNYICMVLRQVDDTYVNAKLSTNPTCMNAYLREILKRGQKVRLTDCHSDLGYARLQILEDSLG